jgi:transposase
MTIPGVGPLIAATVRAVIQDPAAPFGTRSRRLDREITPHAKSSGGKEQIGRISKRENKQLRTLLIVGPVRPEGGAACT